MSKPPPKPLTSETLLEDAELKAVGCLAIESTRLEYMLEALLKDICKLTAVEESIFVPSTWTLGPKAKSVKKLMADRIRSKIRKDKLNAIFSKIELAVDRRNTVIHGRWTSPNAIEQVFGFKNSKAVHPKKPQSAIKASDVMRYARETSEALDELLNFYRQAVRKRRQT